ncbi:sigma-70 family RNA polymerase sigma factor [Pediococcus cellicola]|uniref:RNA polymerase sigma-70 region 2 domain-containing protein n=1 Tax=Pediococcus cellicola TaxID=319652 RepID=A0A0R2IKS2_9LACO|nr:sigma-70 family RNA polymerase sigma factor [Pediococcus cellicola]KRN65451.1 hypothetical protein IV80_GL001957 [Pediococcus cellicola]GEL15351.1 hypothetical protein PCE01_11530 [Pediococcus cellicola]
MEKQTVQDAFKFLYQENREKIIYGAAKKLHLHPAQTNYEDFIQEGYLTFVQAYDRYPSSPLDNPQKFCIYAYQAVYWRFLDLIRQSNRLADQIEVNPLPLVNQAHSNLEEAFEAIYQDELFAQLYNSCTKSEQMFLIDCYVYHLKSSEIACKHHVSRQCVSNWRRRVGNKALAYLTKSRP